MFIYNINKFSDVTISAVWQKGRMILNLDPNVYRRDACGAIIERRLHGHTIPRGWEIDHIFPSVLGGSDILSNLQPLQWENNREKGDNIGLVCKVRS